MNALTYRCRPGPLPVPCSATNHPAGTSHGEGPCSATNHPADTSHGEGRVLRPMIGWDIAQ